MTAAPGPQQPDEVRRVSLSDAHDDYDEDEHPRPAAPSAQPDEGTTAAVADWQVEAGVRSYLGHSREGWEHLGEAARQDNIGIHGSRVRAILEAAHTSAQPVRSLSQQRRLDVQSAQPDAPDTEWDGDRYAERAPSAQPDEVEPRDEYGHTEADHEAAGACRRPSMKARAAAAPYAVLGKDWQRAWMVGWDAARKELFTAGFTPAQPVRDTGEGRR